MLKMTRESMLRAAAATVGGTGLLAAMSAPVRAQSAPITALVLPTVDGAPFYYADKNGLFAKAGLQLTYQRIASGNLAIQAVVSDAAQIGFANSLSLAQAYAHGIPVAVIAGAGLYDANLPVARIFVRNDSTIHTGADLEDRTFAVTGLHDLLALAVRAWLASQGADTTKIRYVELPQAQMLAALQAKRVDAIGSFEPFATDVAASGDARAIAFPYTAIAKQFASTAWFAATPWLANHRDEAARFVRVLRAQTAYSNAHLSEMAPLVAAYTGLTPEVAVRALRNKTIVDARPVDLQPLIDCAAKFGELSASFPAQMLLVRPPL